MKILRAIVIAAALCVATTAHAQLARPTIVLVHGAFADSSSWNGVIRILEQDGYPVVAVANPLRSVQGDAGYVDDLLAIIPCWFIYGSADKNIPPQASAFMATRAHARQTIVIKGGSHVIMISHPAQVAAIIEAAARTAR